MNEVFPTKLLVSQSLSRMDNNALLLYLIIRKHVVDNIPFDKSKLYQKIGLMKPTVERLLNELKRRGWIKEKDGEIVLSDEDGFFLEYVLNKREKKTENQNKEEQVNRTDKVLQERMIKEHQAVMAKQVAKELRTKKRVKKGEKRNAAAVLRCFKRLYEDEYNEEMPMTEKGQKELVFCRRPLKWADDDYDHVIKVIEFLFENWVVIKRRYKIRGERPSLSLLGTASLWQKIREVCVVGLDHEFSIKDRGKPRKSKLTGW